MESLNLVNPVMIPYQEPLPIAFIIMVVVLALISVVYIRQLKIKYKKVKNIPEGDWVVLLIIASVIGGILYLTPSYQKTSNWSYVFDETRVFIFKASKPSQLTLENLVREATYDELTPYFVYEESINSENRSVVIHLILEDGTTFATMSDSYFNTVAWRYHFIHERAPEVLERVMIEEGSRSEFSIFKDYLKVEEAKAKSQIILE